MKESSSKDGKMENANRMRINAVVLSLEDACIFQIKIFPLATFACTSDTFDDIYLAALVLALTGCPRERSCIQRDCG